MDLMTILKFIAALGLVLSMIGGCAFLASRFNLLSNLGRRPGARRMKVQESLILDAKHRMMIVKSDNREHVLLFGPSGDVVVESRDADLQTKNEPETAASSSAVERIVPFLKGTKVMENNA
jgi:flagellar protein FliO/FliZ